MPPGVGYGPYAGPKPEDDPLAELGLTAAYGFDLAPPMPPMAPGYTPPGGGGINPAGMAAGVAPAPQQSGMPPADPMAPPPPPAMAGQMGPAQGLAADPQAQAFLAGKSPEELAQIVMKVRDFNQKRASGGV